MMSHEGSSNIAPSSSARAYQIWYLFPDSRSFTGSKRCQDEEQIMKMQVIRDFASARSEMQVVVSRKNLHREVLLLIKRHLFFSRPNILAQSENIQYPVGAASDAPYLDLSFRLSLRSRHEIFKVMRWCVAGKWRIANEFS